MNAQKHVVFICPHGAAKSVVAAAHYQALAAARGEAVSTASYGIEPDPEVPQGVVDGLRQDGLAVAPDKPVAPSAEALAHADLVVVIGCDLPDGMCAVPIVRWDGVPAVSDGYDAARTDIAGRVSELLDRSA
jgi:protein-tyrosine-phosphatase